MYIYMYIYIYDYMYIKQSCLSVCPLVFSKPLPHTHVFATDEIH